MSAYAYPYQGPMEWVAALDRLYPGARLCLTASPTVLVKFLGADGHDAIQRTDLVMVMRSLVSIVDDDESVRESLPDLLRQFGFAAQAFSSAEEFLTSEFVNQTRCLILDIAMPGMSGPDLQRELASRRQNIPLIFITASADKTLRRRLMADGAVECLFKPFSDAALLDALNAAVRTR